MENVKIYMSGAMSSVSWEEQTKWRIQIKEAIKLRNCDYEKKPVFFDPTEYYNLENKIQNSEREVMEFDLYNLRNSNIIIVNLDFERSTGTAMELMLAKELNIPVIAFNEGNKEVYPWLLECCTRVCDSMEDAISYVVEYFLN